MDNRLQRDDLPDLEEIEQNRRKRIKTGLTVLNLAVVVFLLISSALLFLSAQGEESVLLGSRVLLIEESDGAVLVMVRPEEKNLDSNDEFLYSSFDGKLAVCKVVGVTEEAVQFLPNGDDMALSIEKDDPAYSGKVVLKSGFLGKLCAPIAKRADVIVLYLLIAGILLLVLLLLVLLYVIHQGRRAALDTDEDSDEDYIEEELDEDEDFTSSMPFPLDRVITIPGKDGAPETVRLPEYIASKLTEPPLPKELEEIIQRYSTPPSGETEIDPLLGEGISIKRTRVLQSTEPSVQENEAAVSEQSPYVEKSPARPAAAAQTQPRASSIGQRPLSELSLSDTAVRRLGQKPTSMIGAANPTQAAAAPAVSAKPSASSGSSLRAPVSLAAVKPKSAAEKAQQAYAQQSPEEAARLLEKELREAREVLLEEEKKEIIPPPEKRPFFSLTKPIPFEEFIPPEESRRAEYVERKPENNSKDEDTPELDMDKLAAIMSSLYTGDAGGADKEEAPRVKEPESPLGKLLSGKSRRDAAPEEEEPIAVKHEPSFTELLEMSSRALSADTAFEEDIADRKVKSNKPAFAMAEPDEIVETEKTAPTTPEPRMPSIDSEEPQSRDDDMAELLARRERRRAARDRAALSPSERIRQTAPTAEAQTRPERTQPERTQPERTQPEPTAPIRSEREAAAPEEMTGRAQSARSRTERLSRLERSSRTERTQAAPGGTGGHENVSSPEEEAAASSELLSRLERSTRPARAGQPANPVFDVRDDVPEDFVADLPGPSRRRAEARREREAGLLRQPAAPTPDMSSGARKPVEPPSTVPGSEDELVSELIRELWEKSEP